MDIPAWFSFPEVVAQLRKTSPARDKQGFTVFFTGLSGSGKSTIANALMVKLMEMGGRPTTILDGDVVRKHLSSELGFSKEHRDINIKRKAAYTQRASATNSTVEQFAFTTGCNLIAKTAPGEKYQSPDGVWRTRGSEPPMRDSRCL